MWNAADNTKYANGSSLLAAVSKKIEYYDDEELDQFIGKAGDAYTEEETEIVSGCMYTTLDVKWPDGYVAFSSVALNYRMISKTKFF